jgi:hypothetical protein
VPVQSHAIHASRAIEIVHNNHGSWKVSLANCFRHKSPRGAPSFCDATGLVAAPGNIPKQFFSSDRRLEDGRGELREGGGTVAHLITKLSLVIGTGGCGGTLDGECLVPRKVSIENLPKPTSPYLMLLVEVVCGPGEVIQRVALDTLGSIPRLSFLTCSPSKPMTGCI